MSGPSALFQRAGIALIAGVLLLAGAGCAPQVQRFGPAIERPVLGPDYVRTIDGTRLPLRVWPAEKPSAVIVAVHGFNDYSRAFEWPAELWARQGITTYAYDQRGFGATANPGIWPGSVVLRRDLVEVIGLVRQRHPHVPIYLMGESMGGAVVLSTAASRDAIPGVAGIVLVAPAVWGWTTMNVFYGTALWVGAHTFPWKSFTGEHLKIWPCDNLVALRQLWRDPLVIKKTRTDSIYGLVGMMDDGFLAAPQTRLPTLVLYGDKDEIVPKEPVQRMVRGLAGPVRFLRYRRGYHMLLRDQDGPLLWGDIRDWIADHNAPLFGREEVPRPPLTQAARSSPQNQERAGAGAGAATMRSNSVASCSASCAPDRM